VNSIDFNRGVLMVRQGKGQKDRVVPIGDRALSWIKQYMDDVRPRVAVEPDDGTLFLTPDGLPYGTENMGRVVREKLDRAGIKKRGACHLFRHSMATAMLENGADVRYIQEMLGHADLNSTQLYTHVSIRKLKEVHDATHPAARLARAQAVAPAAVSADLAKIADLQAALDVEGDEEDTPPVGSPP
jgi:integrase/recombinase XerD